MSQFNEFIESIELSGDNQIVIGVQKPLVPFLKHRKSFRYLSHTTKKVLGSDFKGLEIEEDRVIVFIKSGTGDKNLALIESELIQSFQVLKPFLPKK